MKFKKAKEPTNIIWENRMFLPNMSIIRVIIFCVTVTIVFGLTFYATFMLQTFIEKQKNEHD